MLNQDSLSQLRDLKSQMEAEKERADALIKGTQARYGFAVLDDGREVFIPPQEMLKAFPNDRVRVCIRPTPDNKTIAEIERLLDSPLQEFTGQCVRKGKALFIQPDLPQLTRWLFVPPHARNGVKEGDYVRAAVLRHPIRDGKPQCKVLTVLGDIKTPGIENAYAIAKYHLPSNWSSATSKEVEQLIKEKSPLDTENRRDLTDLEFVSIDAAKTQDIDDALYAEISSGGWNLYVAIADPTAYIGTDSQLHSEIATRATSVYFHGDVVPMLPEALSQDTCALSQDMDRPALVCKVAISDDGEVGAFEFIEAKVRSRAKLSYFAVDRYLNGQNDELMSHATPLEALYQVYRALRAHREEHHILMEERREFRWILGDDKRIESIEPYEKLLSQRLVEECMVAANRCAARFLAEHNASGPYVQHAGFRKDRLKELATFLERHAPELADHATDTLTGYRDIVRGLASGEHPLPLRTMLNRFLTRAELVTAPAPHMGMSLPNYTNCTSPLRKYTDFLVHLQIKSLLHGGDMSATSKETVAQISRQLSNCRAATQEAQRWLAHRYLEKLAAAAADSQRITFDAQISYVNSGGFSVRLVDNGLEGYVDLRPDAEKFSFDKWTASLTSTTRRFQLEQPVQLHYLGASADNGWQAQFAVIEGCGIKPAKIEKTETTEKIEATEKTQPEQVAVTAPTQADRKADSGDSPEDAAKQ